MLIMSLICVKFVYIDAKSLVVVLKKKLELEMGLCFGVYSMKSDFETLKERLKWLLVCSVSFRGCCRIICLAQPG